MLSKTKIYGSIGLFFLLFNITKVQGQNALDSLSVYQLESILERYAKSNRPNDSLILVADLGFKKATLDLKDKDSTYANLLYFKGFSHLMRQDVPEALNYLHQAASIQKNIKPENHKYARTLNLTGMLTIQIGDFLAAEQNLRESARVFKAALGSEHFAATIPLNNLAIMYQRTNRFKEAEVLYLECKNIYEKLFGGKHPNYSMILNNLAIVYQSLGHHEKAEPLYLQCRDIYKRQSGKDNIAYANATYNLAGLYLNLQRLDLAIDLAEETLGIYEALYGPDHVNYAECLNNLAIMYSEVDDHEKAEQFFLHSMKLRLDKFSENDAVYLDLAISYATFLRLQGQFEKALERSLINERIALKLFGKLHLKYAEAVLTSTSCYSKLKQYDLAEKLGAIALKINTDKLGNHHEISLRNYNILAENQLYANNIDKAIEYCRVAIRLNTNTQLDWSALERWPSLKDQAMYSADELIHSLKILFELLSIHKKENIKSMILLCEQILGILEQSRNVLENTEDKLRLLKKSEEWLQRQLQLMSLDTQLSEAFSIAERGKSVLLMEANNADRAFNFGLLPDSLKQLEKDLIQKHSKLTAKYALANNNEIKIALNDVSIELKDFKKQLEIDYPEYAKVKYLHQSAKMNEVQELLDDAEACIEFSICDSNTYVFYLDHENAKAVALNISKNDLNEKIKAFHELLSNYSQLQNEPEIAFQNYVYLAHWFYDKLLAPILDNQKSINHLIIIADGLLATLPFEAFLMLPVSQKTQEYGALPYLIKNYRISYDYSASLWKENKEKAADLQNNGALFAMAADYSIALDSLKSKHRIPFYKRLRAKLSPLPFARIEVETIARKFKGSYAYDEQASEKNFKANANQYSVIHLALHGILNKDKPILSSLGFTEDSDSMENNFLEAHEISKLELNTDLVVLSACETGYGKFENGNGLASLARAFMYAGAKSLVVSLWQVNDYSTAKIMENFYSNLSEKKDKSSALRAAKLNYLKTSQGIMGHPAFWSSFILYGNDEAIELKSKELPWRSIALAFSALILVGIMTWRKLRYD